MKLFKEGTLLDGSSPSDNIQNSKLLSSKFYSKFKMANYVDLTAVYIHRRCRLSILYVFKLNDHIWECLLKNAIYHIEIQNGYICKLGVTPFSHNMIHMCTSCCLTFGSYNSISTHITEVH